MPKAGPRLYTVDMPIARDRILYQDDQFLVVNKLSRELVVAGKGKMEKLPLLDFLKKDHPGIQTVHRLDFETSGIVVFAKNRAILSSIIDTNFAGWEKQYQAIIAGGISGKGEIDKIGDYYPYIDKMESEEPKKEAIIEKKFIPGKFIASKKASGRMRDMVELPLLESVFKDARLVGFNSKHFILQQRLRIDGRMGNAHR